METLWGNDSIKVPSIPSQTLYNILEMSLLNFFWSKFRLENSICLINGNRGSMLQTNIFVSTLFGSQSQLARPSPHLRHAKVSYVCVWFSPPCFIELSGKFRHTLLNFVSHLFVASHTLPKHSCGKLSYKPSMP
jgi:hypothetical protein